MIPYRHSKPPFGTPFSAIRRRPTAYWPFNEGRGYQLYNVAQPTALGTLNSNPVWIGVPAHGIGLKFDGSSQYVSGTGIDLANKEFSISLWFVTSTFTDRTVFSLGSNQGSLLALHLRLTSSTSVKFGLFNDDLDATVPDMSNRLTNLIFTRTAAGKTIFCNGSQVASNGSTFPFTGDTSWNIARWIANGGQYFEGIISSIAVYEQALTAAESFNLFVNPFSDFLYASPFHHWALQAAAGGGGGTKWSWWAWNKYGLDRAHHV